MARLKLVLAFFALVILAAGVLVAAWYWKNFFKPNWVATREIESLERGGGRRGNLPDLGLREFQAAEDLLIDGELQAARDRLYYLMEFYPDSKVFPDAKRVVGEINLDLLLSRSPIAGKKEHVVKRGDLLSPIARKNRTSINYMMRAGGRTNSVIFPGDRLVVYPLNFKVRISLETQTITILTPEDGRFFKEYAIEQTNLPARLTPPVSTKIAEMVAWRDGRPISFESSHYFEANKWIRTGALGLFIRATGPPPRTTNEKGEPVAIGATPVGVMVSRPDLEEMFAYLRTTNAVTLVP